jgi:hypothetical protein
MQRAYKKRLSKNVAVVLGSIFSISLYAAELYVSPNGNNDNKGTTAAAPFKTITKASQIALPGDTVHVGEGIYYENVRTLKSGTATARIRYVSDKKGKAVIIGSGINFMWENRGNYTDIVDFDISGSGRIGILNLGSFVKMIGNHVHDLKISGGCNGGGGAGINNGNYSGSDNDIIGNIVHDIGIPGSCNTVQGIYHSNLRGNILNNIVYRVSSHGISLWHAPDNVMIFNNTVFANGSKTMGGGIHIGSGDAPGGIIVDNTKVINNIVYDNPRLSIGETCGAGFNCIGDNNLYANNLVYNNGREISLRRGVAVGTISADPQFVNYQANVTGDYRLKDTSPAINKGLVSGAPTTDLNGLAREGAPDIGAYEYKGINTAPNANFSPLSLSFEATKVGARSSSSIVTIKNFGSASLILKSLKVSGDFSIADTGNCVIGQTYAPSASCTVELAFAPSLAGVRSGALSVESNNSPALANIPLSGTGMPTASVVSISSSALRFGNVQTGSSSSVQTVTLTNSGDASLTFTQPFALTGDFVLGSNGTCRPNFAYAPKASCTVSVIFKPTVAGIRNGVFNIVSNASNGPQQISLSGTGLKESKPVAGVSIQSLSFGNTKLKTTSVVKIVTVTNIGNAPLIFSQPSTISGLFKFGGQGTCKNNFAYAPGQGCNVSAVFAPTSLGAQSGVLSILSNAPTISVGLNGNGVK